MAYMHSNVKSYQDMLNGGHMGPEIREEYNDDSFLKAHMAWMKGEMQRATR
jgi:hypothetical protein